MLMRAPLLVMAVAFLATACSEDAPLPPLEDKEFTLAEARAQRDL
jgi:hypothetical protein